MPIVILKQAKLIFLLSIVSSQGYVYLLADIIIAPQRCKCEYFRIDHFIKNIFVNSIHYTVAVMLRIITKSLL